MLNVILVEWCQKNFTEIAEKTGSSDISDYADKIRRELQEVKNKLGDHNTAQAVAEIACRLVHPNMS